MVVHRSQPGSADRTQREVSDGENQVGQRESAPESESIGDRAANHGEKPHPTAEHPGQTARALDVEMQAFVQVARQNGENGVVRKPFKQLADIRNPEWPLKSSADFFEALRKGQVAPVSMWRDWLLCGAGAPVRDCRRNRMSCTQTIANILPSHSHHAHDLIPAGLASGNGNGRSRHLQKFREEFNAGPVRSSLDRRSSKRNLQRVAEFAGNRVLLRTWMNLDRKANSTVGFMKGNHAFLPSENRVSTASSPATSTICGFASVRTCPMLIINAAANTSIVRLAAMQNIRSPCIPYPLRMRNTFSMPVKSKARSVPSSQILPV